MIKNYDIRVRGIVQGVGFRPFIFRLALEYNISGFVLNDSEGVLISAEGEEENIRSFTRKISYPPPLSLVNAVETKENTIKGYKGFSIKNSKNSSSRSVFIPPDTAVCDECLKEFFCAEDRRYGYPFITCTNCGPRFSIVRDIPYDRSNTSMSGFNMCHACMSEYSNAADRRFHTQPDACAECGPRMMLCSNNGDIVAEHNVAAEAVKLLRQGAVFAIKGTGGYLIAADACSDNAVGMLRHRKQRPFKPFAVMSGSIDAARRFLHISAAEEKLLAGRERPIVLLKECSSMLSRLVAPGLSYIGFMLPYMPFQHHLFSIDPELTAIMTSGNISDEPIVFREEDAFKKLASIADYIITYNREIEAQSDDSVLFVQDEKPFFVRRSRGYVPVPFFSEQVHTHLLATGGDLKNSFALARDNIVILSQFLGDMASPESSNLYRNTIEHFRRIYAFTPRAVISDMHPGYFTTLFADEMEEAGMQRLRVQHHHAHIASVLEDNNIYENVIGIAFDGTGYGTDGKLWGSELFVCSRKEFSRAGHFSYFQLPGGESAIKDVWKTGVSLLYSCFGSMFPVMKRDMHTDIVTEIISRKINSPETCSIGRLFDGVSSMLGICRSISTEAEAAMLLEEAAFRGASAGLLLQRMPEMRPVPDENGCIIADINQLIRYIVYLFEKGENIDRIAYAFHVAVSAITVNIAEMIRDKYGINTAALSGGVFHNRILLKLIMNGLTESGFAVTVPRNVPFNDGCIALGQISSAREQLK